MNTTTLETTIRSQASIVLNDGERQRCEVWTRVMGYHRPVSSFNTGKKGEFAERRYFEERRCSAPAVP
jgi:anaerobic ribonucleoside-triphosphate reductase